MKKDGPWYGQRGEDRKIAELLGERMDDPRPGFYINVGAFHPTSDSITKHFYDRGWCGINIEPVKAFYDLFKVERTRDFNIHAAVDTMVGKKMFNVVKDTGVSTFRSSYAKKWQDQNYSVEQVEVDTVRLDQICFSLVALDQEIDFLAVDVEGWEQSVILSADWKNYRPKVLCFEATEPGTSDHNAIPTWDAWEPLLFSARYVFRHDDGLNRFYTRVEDE